MLDHLVNAFVPVLAAAGGLTIRLMAGAVFIAALVAPMLVLAVGFHGVTMLFDAATGVRHLGHLRWRVGTFYDKSHLWLRPRRVDRIRVGLDDIAQRVLPDAEAVVLPQAGARVQKGDRLGQVRCASGAVQLHAPIAGTVLGVNDRLLRRPSLLRRDPYRRGWLVELQPRDRSYATLPTGEHARAWLDAEDRKLTMYLEDALGLAHADGGELVELPHRLLTDAQWRALRERFMGGID